MLYLYCLPGKVFASLRYLWPGKNQTLATGRRRDSRFAHFVYATIFWGVILWLFVLPHFVTPSRVRTRDNQNADLPSNASPLLTSIDAQTAGEPSPEAAAQQHDDEPATSPDTAHDLDDDRRLADQNGNKSAAPEQTPDLLAIEAVQKAMRKAFSSGKAKRWHAGKLRGYAVPSEVVMAGCRTMAVSNDKQPDATVQTKICE